MLFGDRNRIRDGMYETIRRLRWRCARRDGNAGANNRFIVGACDRMSGRIDYSCVWAKGGIEVYVYYSVVGSAGNISSLK